MAVVKVTNIGWDFAIEEVHSYLSEFDIPIGHRPPHFHHGIHIIMDRSTGKTINECFVEFPNAHHARQALRLRRRGLIRGRSVSLELSSQNDLLMALFPQLAIAERPTENFLAINSFSFHEKSFAASIDGDRSTSSETSSERNYLTRDDIYMLLSCAKPCRSQSFPTRKCPRRPFENIISILSKIPWHQQSLVPVIQRDHIFELTKLGTESLRMHVQRGSPALDMTFLETFVRAALCVPLFTEKQKTIILATARVSCPPELEPFVVMPPDPEAPDQQNPESDTLGGSEQPVPSLLKMDAVVKPAMSAPASIMHLPNNPTRSFAAHSTTPPIHSQSGDRNGYFQNNNHQHQQQNLTLIIDTLLTRIKSLEQELQSAQSRYDQLVAAHTDQITTLRTANQHLLDQNRHLERVCGLLKAHCVGLESQRRIMQ